MVEILEKWLSNIQGYLGSSILNCHESAQILMSYEVSGNMIHKIFPLENCFPYRPHVLIKSKWLVTKYMFICSIGLSLNYNASLHS